MPHDRYDDAAQMAFLTNYAKQRRAKVIARRNSVRQLKIKVQKFFRINTRG